MERIHQEPIILTLPEELAARFIRRDNESGRKVAS
jgi:hypothetical protein